MYGLPQGNMKKIGIALLIFNMPVLAGCAGGNAIDQAVPQAAFADANAPVPADRPATDAAASPGTDDSAAADTDPVFSGSARVAETGTFPNINEEPHGATAQLTDAQRDALVAEMQVLGETHARGGISTAEYQRRLEQLRLLAATHSDDAIKKIEE
jgi:hypothetical protein